MQLNLEPGSAQQLHGLACLLHRVTALVQLKNMIVAALRAKLHPGHAIAAQALHFCRIDIVRASLNHQPDVALIRRLIETLRLRQHVGEVGAAVEREGIRIEVLAGNDFRVEASTDGRQNGSRADIGNIKLSGKHCLHLRSTGREHVVCHVLHPVGGKIMLPPALLHGNHFGNLVRARLVSDPDDSRTCFRLVDAAGHHDGHDHEGGDHSPQRNSHVISHFHPEVDKFSY